MHAVRMRDIVRSEFGAPARLAQAFDAMTEAELTPWYRATSTWTSTGKPRSTPSSTGARYRLRQMTELPSAGP